MKSETVGPYRILRECGRGSYGVVYLARSSISGERVALKLLDGAHEARELEGLIRCRECRHANLIRIRHVDRLPDGRLYYTMDAADDRGGGGGYEPDTLAARGRIAAAELIPILNALLDALAELHRHKLVHRDIKPENILFVDRVPVLGDIGLAAPSGNASMVGTPSFLPPEVLTGARSPDEASDLYALGGVAYVALTGNPPHKYPQLPRDLPPDSSRVLEFCRAARGRNATPELCRTALNSPPRRSLRRCLPAAILLVFVLAAAGTLWFGRSGRRAVPAASSDAPPPVVKPPVVKPPPAADPDAELKRVNEELAQVIRRGEADLAAAREQAKKISRQLTPEEFRAEVGELEKKYPIPDELRRRAKEHYDAVRRKCLAEVARVSPFTPEGRAVHDRADETLRRHDREDDLYRIGSLNESIEFFRSQGVKTGSGVALWHLEKFYSERAEIVRKLENSPK